MSTGKRQGVEKFDRVEEVSPEEKSRLLAQFLFVGADLGMWCFDKNRRLYYSTCSHEREFLAFLELGNCMDYLYGRPEGWEKPVILSDELGLLWSAVTRIKNGAPDLYFLMGPAFLSHTSLQSIENALREKESSLYIRRQMMRTLEAVPVLSLPMFYQYTKMLHYAIFMERISPGDFYCQSGDLPQELPGGAFLPLAKEEEEMAEPHGDPERAARAERRLLQAIEEGNPEYFQMLEREADCNGELVSRSGDALRDAKNTALVFGALASRAAIAGGAPLRTIKEIELAYTARIEKCDTITKLTHVNGQMMAAYVEKVRQAKENPLISQTVRECCDYIRTNVLKPLTVEELADQRGYTTYYFSKKFYKEMGIRVTDYIKQARVEYARIALLTTRQSIQEISDSLHFGTRNYFSSVFRELVGVTPAAYREQSGRSDKEA